MKSVCATKLKRHSTRHVSEDTIIVSEFDNSVKTKLTSGQITTLKVSGSLLLAKQYLYLSVHYSAEFEQEDHAD